MNKIKYHRSFIFLLKSKNWLENLYIVNAKVRKNSFIKTTSLFEKLLVFLQHIYKYIEMLPVYASKHGCFKSVFLVMIKCSSYVIDLNSKNRFGQEMGFLSL